MDSRRSIDLLSRLTADRVGGLIWLVFGAAVFYGSWTMDRLESQNINPVTVPGLVPGLLGIGIMVFALVLLFRPGAAPAKDGPEEREAQAAPEPQRGWKRLALSWLLCMAFAGVLLGRGLPFWLLAGSFTFLHILLLDDPDRVAAKPLARRALVAAIIAVCTAAVVTTVFQEVFLVRLP